MKNCKYFLYAIGFLTLATLAAAQSDKQTYLPVDPTINQAGSPGLSVWDFSAVPTIATTLPLSYADHSFSYMSLEAALKLGINYVGVKASGNFSVLVAESRRFDALPAKLRVKVGGVETTYNAVALVGVACRANLLAKAGELELKIGTNAVGIDAKVKAVSESMAFSAIGFTNYAPFNLTINDDGTVNLNEIRKSVATVFNEYSKSAGDLSDAKLRVLGFRVPPTFPEIKTIESIKVESIG